MSDLYFKAWEAVFDKQIAASLQNSKAVYQETAHRLLKKIEDRTPVGNPSLWHWPAHSDYNPGTLKASWTLSYTGDVITITNSQPYAQRVEFGWSTQAPNGMLRVSLLDYPRLLDEVAKERKL